MADNHVTVVGNATRSAELRFTPSGQAVASFGLAVNRRWQNKQTQEWDEQTSFFDVTCWAQLAQNVADSIEKGARVIVSGRLEQRSWENDTGEKRSKIEIVADDVGPSLKWATAEVARNERSDSSSGGTGGSGSSRTSKPSGGGAGGYNPDEEPFINDYLNPSAPTAPLFG